MILSLLAAMLSEFIGLVRRVRWALALFHLFWNSTHRRLYPGHGGASLVIIDVQLSFPPLAGSHDAITDHRRYKQSQFPIIFSIRFLVSGNTFLIRKFYVSRAEQRPWQRPSLLHLTLASRTFAGTCWEALILALTCCTTPTPSRGSRTNGQRLLRFSRAAVIARSCSCNLSIYVRECS
jgi:hypothetical protein